MRSLFRVKVIYPVLGPIIFNGALVIRDQKIEWVGRYSDFSDFDLIDATYEFPNHIIFPGLINLHCHLGLTDLVGKIPQNNSFSEWAQGVLAILGNHSSADPNRQVPLFAGVKQLVLKSGVTTIVDHCPNSSNVNPFFHPPKNISARIISCFEFGGVMRGMNDDEIVGMAEGHIGACERNGAICALAPHAPYSVSASVFDKLFNHDDFLKVKFWSMHMGESKEEYEYFTQKSGSMWKWLSKSAGRPVYPRESGPFFHTFGAKPPDSQFLLIHGNYLSFEELDLTKKMGWGLVHCPNSFEYFNHDRNPIKDWEEIGISWGIGTDSLATAVVDSGARDPELNLFSEARLLSSRQDLSISYSELMEKTTHLAARMIGMDSDIGALKSGMLADFNILEMPHDSDPVDQQSEFDFAQYIFNSGQGRLKTFIGGKEVVF